MIMKNFATDLSPNKTARIAGFLYLIYMVTHIISDVWRDSFIVPGETAATTANISTHEGLFSITVVGDLLAAALFLLAAWALYVLLKPVNKNFALLFLLLNLAGVTIQSISAINIFAAQLLMNGTDYLNVFQADQLQSLAMLFLDLREKGFLIAQLFYSIWLFPLGYLVYKSGFLPKFLGIVLMIHFFTWVSTFFQSFLFPGFNLITYVSYPLGFIAEFGLTLWLLIKGVKKTD
jgi:hypothetical protein